MRPFRLAVTVAALAALTLVPVSAQGARAKKALPDRVYAGLTQQGLPAFVRLGNTRTPTVTAAVTWGAKCSDGDRVLFWNGGKDLVVDKRGHFAAQQAEDATHPRVALTGALGKSSVEGTFRAKETFRDGHGKVTAVCDSGLIKWSLARSGYGGQTSGQGFPVVVSFDKGKTRVERVVVVTPLRCRGGNNAVLEDRGNFVLTRAGAFGDEFDLPSPSENATYHVSFHGTLGKTRASGTWRLTAVFRDAQGNQTDTCDSGPLTWSAAM